MRTDTKTGAPTSDADQLGFSPAVSSDWTVVPETVSQGLNEIAGYGVQNAVTAAAAITADYLVRGDDGSRGITTSALSLLGGSKDELTGVTFLRTTAAGNPYVMEFISAGASAVNYLGFCNHITTFSPAIMARGTDTEIGIEYWLKGTTHTKSHIFRNGAGTFKFGIGNSELTSDLPLKLKEAAAAVADTAAYGQFWVKTATPCQPWYTDDAGTDARIVVTPMACDIDMAGYALDDDSVSPKIPFKIDGSEVARFADDGTLLIGQTTSGSDKWKIQAVEDNGSCNAVFDSYSSLSGSQSQFQFRRSRGTPGSEANVQAGDKIGSLAAKGWGGAWNTLGNMRWEMDTAAACEGYFAAGSNDNYLTIFNGGDINFAASGVRVSWGTPDFNYIELGSGTLTINSVSNTYFDINETREMALCPGDLEFGPSGTAYGGITFGNDGEDYVYLRASATERLRVSDTGIGFFGATPIAQPDYTMSNVTTTRTLDADDAGLTLAELADVVGTLIEDLIDYGLLQ